VVAVLELLGGPTVLDIEFLDRMFPYLD